MGVACRIGPRSLRGGLEDRSDSSVMLGTLGTVMGGPRLPIGG